MEYEMNVTPTEIMDLHRDSQRRGFFAGVIFCVTAKYLWDRRREEAKINGNRYKINQ